MKRCFVLLFILGVTVLAQGSQKPPSVDGAGVALQQLAEVTDSQLRQNFGSAVAVSGDTLVISVPGASIECNGAPSCGAAYIYTAPGGDWSSRTQVATLTQANGEADDVFGAGVAISGKTIAVGGFDSTTGTDAVYIFVEPSTGWADMTQTATLSLNDKYAQGIVRVAMAGGTVVAGVPFSPSYQGVYEGGAAYVFVQPTGGWVNMNPTAQLVTTGSGKTLFGFGFGVSVSGSAIVVGAAGATVMGLRDEGTAYLFLNPSGGWAGTVQQTTTFEPSDGATNWLFGFSASISGETAVIGAPEAGVGSHDRQGAAYIYAEPDGGWPSNMTETAKLSAANGTSGDEFGYALTSSGSTVVIGAPYVRNLQGVSYLFSTQDYSERAPILASDGAPGDFFGESIAIGGGVIVIGAPSTGDANDNQPASVYVFGSAR
jgi:hypothetical protein